MNAIGLANGKQFVDMGGTEYLADSENQNPVPGFSDALLGIEPGQAKKFTLDIPDGFRDEEVAGSRGEFEVTVTSLREKILPELRQYFRDNGIQKAGKERVKQLVNEALSFLKNIPENKREKFELFVQMMIERKY